MFSPRLLSLAAALLVISTGTFSQDSPPAAQAGHDEAILKKPHNIQVVLSRRPPGVNETEDDVAKPYKRGEKVYFLVKVISNHPRPVTMLSLNPFYQNRPLLTRGGERIAYREDVEKLLPSVDDEVTFFRVFPITLEPGAPTQAGILDLNQWYGTLEPGEYQVTNRYRFAARGEWVETSELNFSVVEN